MFKKILAVVLIVAFGALVVPVVPAFAGGRHHSSGVYQGPGWVNPNYGGHQGYRGHGHRGHSGPGVLEIAGGIVLGHVSSRVADEVLFPGSRRVVMVSTPAPVYIPAPPVYVPAPPVYHAGSALNSRAHEFGYQAGVAGYPSGICFQQFPDPELQGVCVGSWRNGHAHAVNQSRVQDMIHRGGR